VYFPSFFFFPAAPVSLWLAALGVLFFFGNYYVFLFLQNTFPINREERLVFFLVIMNFVDIVCRLDIVSFYHNGHFVQVHGWTSLAGMHSSVF